MTRQETIWKVRLSKGTLPEGKGVSKRDWRREDLDKSSKAEGFVRDWSTGLWRDGSGTYMCEAVYLLRCAEKAQHH